MVIDKPKQTSPFFIPVISSMKALASSLPCSAMGAAAFAILLLLVVSHERDHSLTARPFVLILTVPLDGIVRTPVLHERGAHRC